MGWICITDGCEGHIINGIWDGTGVAYFSISEEITVLHDIFFEFLFTISGTMFMFLFLLLILTLIISIVINIRKLMKNVY